MKNLIVSVVLFVLVIETISFLALIFKNEKLSLNGKMLWSAVIIFLPMAGGVVYFTQKGTANV